MCNYSNLYYFLRFTHCVLIKLSIEVRLGATPGVGYPEGEECLARRRRNIDTARVGVLSLRRDYPLKGLSETEVDVHVVLPAHHLQRLDGRHPLRPLQGPDFTARYAPL